MSPFNNAVDANLPLYPPAAAQKKNVVSEQPAPAPGMLVSPSVKSLEQKAMRIRGGCIPCPDGGCCYIIPLPCCCC